MMNRSLRTRHGGKRLNLFNNADHAFVSMSNTKLHGGLLLSTNGPGAGSSYQDAPSAYLRKPLPESKNIVMGNGLREKIKELKDDPLKKSRFEKLSKLNLKNKNITF